MELASVELGKTQSGTFPFRDEAGRVHQIALDEVERIAWRDTMGKEGMVSSRHYSFVIPGRIAGRFSRDGAGSNPKRLCLKRRDGSDEMEVEVDLIYMVRWLDRRGYEHALERENDVPATGDGAPSA